MGSSTNRVLLVESLLYAASRAMPGAATVLIALVLVRLLRPEGYAYYAVAMSSATVAATFSTGWIRQASMRQAGGDRVVHLLTGKDYAAVLLPAVLISVVLFWLAGGAMGRGALTAVAALSLALSVQMVLFTDLQSNLDVASLTRAEIARGALTALSVCAIAAILPDWRLAVGATAAVIALCYARWIVRIIVQRSTDRSSTQLRAWWSYGWPMSVWLGIAMVAQYGDRLLINRLLDPTAAGSYAALADVIVRGAGLILVPITMAAAPRVMRLWNERRQVEAMRLNQRAMRYQVVALVPLLLVVSLLAGELGFLVVGSSQSKWLIIGLFVGTLMWQVAMNAHKRLELLGRTRLMALLIATATIVGLALSAALVPVVGATGAAVGYASGGSLYLLLVFVVGQASDRRRPGREPSNYQPVSLHEGAEAP